MAIRTFSLKLIIFLFMAGQVSASETMITNRSDFENLVIEKKLKRFLISLSVIFSTTSNKNPFIKSSFD